MRESEADLSPSPGANSIFVICMRGESREGVDEVWGESYCRIRILSWEDKRRWAGLERNSLLWREVKHGCFISDCVAAFLFEPRRVLSGTFVAWHHRITLEVSMTRAMI